MKTWENFENLEIYKRFQKILEILGSFDVL